MSPSRISRHVIKLGGASLFSSEPSIQLFEGYFRECETRAPFQRTSSQHFVIVGGGDTVESMRTIHRLHPKLDLREMHWRCVDLLDTTWDIATTLFPSLKPITDRNELDQILASGEQGWYLVRVTSYYHRSQLEWIPEHFLPRENWDTTTDALAWLLAYKVHALELELIKKPVHEFDQSFDDAASQGLIDPEISRFAKADSPRVPFASFLTAYDINKKRWTRCQLRRQKPDHASDSVAIGYRGLGNPVYEGNNP